MTETQVLMLGNKIWRMMRMRRRMMMLQKHYLVLEKKEEYAKTTLIESQSKWTLFSKDILNIAKELLNTLDAL